MCGPYWRQWDKSDLDSWLGKDEVVEDDHEDVEEESSSSDECDCGRCLECYGMSESDFL